MADKKQRTKKFLLDLTSLEITTIVTDNISAESMGDPQQAIERISSLYASKLDAIAATHGAPDPGKAAARKDVSAKASDASGGATRSAIRDRERQARRMKRKYGAQLSQEDHGHIDRIRDRSRELEGSNDKLGGSSAPTGAGAQIHPAPQGPEAAERPEFSPEDMVALRKIWELGVEPIAAHTVIQVSGDVITRLHPRYATGQHSMVLELHRTGTSIATEMWSSLIDTAVSILDKIIDR